MTSTDWITKNAYSSTGSLPIRNQTRSGGKFQMPFATAQLSHGEVKATTIPRIPTMARSISPGQIPLPDTKKRRTRSGRLKIRWNLI
jgi:hypothetical protein